MKNLKKKIVAIVEARMTSSRLPGKVMLEILGKPILGYIFDSLKQVDIIDDIVLATTDNSSDDCLIDYAKSKNIKFYRGSEEDVLNRVKCAADYYNADIVVEITGDCPLIDPEIVEQIINIYLNNNADYVSNAHIRTYPDGMDVQVFSLKTLKLSSSMTNRKLDKEHVTLHIRNNPDIFRIINVMAPSTLHRPQLGLTLDQIEDFRLISKIIEYFSKSDKKMNCKNIINYLDKNKNLLKLNYLVERRGNN